MNRIAQQLLGWVPTEFRLPAAGYAGRTSK